MSCSIVTSIYSCYHATNPRGQGRVATVMEMSGKKRFYSTSEKSQVICTMLGNFKIPVQSQWKVRVFHLKVGANCFTIILCFHIDKAILFSKLSEPSLYLLIMARIIILQVSEKCLVVSERSRKSPGFSFLWGSIWPVWSRIEYDFCTLVLRYLHVCFNYHLPRLRSLL